MVYIPFFIFHPLMTRVKLNLTILVFILRLPTKHTLDLISYLSSPVLTRHVICEGMHTTLMAQVIIFDIPSSLISLTRHAWYVLSWTKQRQTHSLFKKKKKRGKLIPCRTVDSYNSLQPRLKSDCRCIFVAKDFTPLWGSVEVLYEGRASWSRF